METGMQFMVQFTTTIHQFEEKAEKTGWTYITIPAEVTEKLKPGFKKSFRVKGWLDKYAIRRVALIPIGGGTFIMAINAAMRKAVGKGKGAMVSVQLATDDSSFQADRDLLECLADEPAADDAFKKMSPSHQHYYNNWIEQAKTPATKARRIAMTVSAMLEGLNFGEMIRAARKKSNTFIRD